MVFSQPSFLTDHARRLQMFPFLDLTFFSLLSLVDMYTQRIGAQRTWTAMQALLYRGRYLIVVHGGGIHV